MKKFPSSDDVRKKLGITDDDWDSIILSEIAIGNICVDWEYNSRSGVCPGCICDLEYSLVDNINYPIACSDKKATIEQGAQYIANNKYYREKMNKKEAGKKKK